MIHLVAVDFANSIAGYFSGVGTLFAGIAAVQTRINGRKVDELPEMRRDLNEMREETASVARALGRHLRQSDLDRRRLHLPSTTNGHDTPDDEP